AQEASRAGSVAKCACRCRICPISETRQQVWQNLLRPRAIEFNSRPRMTYMSARKKPRVKRLQTQVSARRTRPASGHTRSGKYLMVASTHLAASWTTLSVGRLREKIVTINPCRSSSRISFRMNVSERRGNILTTRPTRHSASVFTKPERSPFLPLRARAVDWRPVGRHQTQGRYGRVVSVVSATGQGLHQSIGVRTAD